jgi:Cu/Ag efflux pump CusA
MIRRAAALLLLLAGCSAPEPELEPKSLNLPRVRLAIDPGMLDRYGITMESIVRGLRTAGFKPIAEDGLRLTLRTLHAEDLRKVVVGHHAGATVELRDVALIELLPQ